MHDPWQLAVGPLASFLCCGDLSGVRTGGVNRVSRADGFFGMPQVLLNYVYLVTDAAAQRVISRAHTFTPHTQTDPNASSFLNIGSTGRGYPSL